MGEHEGPGRQILATNEGVNRFSPPRLKGSAIFAQWTSFPHAFHGKLCRLTVNARYFYNLLTGRHQIPHLTEKHQSIEIPIYDRRARGDYDVLRALRLVSNVYATRWTVLRQASTD
jgi:hypothetical protein